MMRENVASVHLKDLPSSGVPRLLHQTMQRQLRRLAHLMFLLFLFSLTSCDNGVAAQRREGRTYPLLGSIPETDFNCRGHPAGYYADLETGCQVYHMCDTLEKQYSYLCPNYTLFNQKFMVCDHWYMVNCSSAADFYSLNDHIGEVPGSGENGNDANDIKATSARKTTTSSRETSLKEAKFAPVAFTFKAPGSSPRPPVPTNSLVQDKSVSAPRPSSSLRPFTSSQTSTTRAQPTFTTQRPQTTQTTPRTSSTRIQQTVTSTAKPTTTRFFQTSRSSFLQTLKPTVATTPRPTFSQTLSTSVHQSTRPTEKPAPIRPTEKASPTRPTEKPSPAAPSRFFELPNIESIFQSIPNSLTKPSPPPSVFLQPPQQPTGSSLVSVDAKSGAGNNTSSHHVNFSFDHMIPFVQTPPPGTPFTMVPGVVARGTGNKFTFSSSQKKPFDEIDFNSIFFQPLVLRPKEKNRKIFTTAPASIILDPHHHQTSGSDQETQHSTTTLFAAPPSANSSTNNGRSNSTSHIVGLRFPSLLQQPSPLVSANVPPFLPTIQQTLIPPTIMKQEFLTPLVTPIRSGLLPLQVTSGIVPSSRFKFPVSRSSRDFFIPSPGLTLPKEDPTVGDKDSIEELQNVLFESVQPKKTNMTMVFPEPRNVELTTLQINPECPKCHPGFLRPGQCIPCVHIK
ncbi:uncharacterized protein DKFZp434B061-like [Palaemon carinicauda]|uniref:uncharacterized protein DKFZp434B061-like n=1 Tax=Palaemon carinicauda TaxID=392227 RepID=UPI0035B60468